MLNALLVLAAFTANSPEAKVTAKNVPQLEAEVADISGYYTCKGVETGGKTYQRVVVIERKGDVYVVKWVIGSGSTFTGIGIRQSNTFAASWALPGPNGQLARGINVYRVEAVSGNARFSGRWANMPGNGVLQSETLTFLKALDEEE
ncbi:MAG: hypothetical protein Q7S10_03365 [bacterium]|nr:hypothetical protein [bacterium]